jgi:hypothetical protein
MSSFANDDEPVALSILALIRQLLALRQDSLKFHIDYCEQYIMKQYLYRPSNIQHFTWFFL